jgi:hypothetical protein
VDGGCTGRRGSRTSSGMADDGGQVAVDLQATSAIGPNQAGMGSVHLLGISNTDPWSVVAQWAGQRKREGVSTLVGIERSCIRTAAGRYRVGERRQLALGMVAKEGRGIVLSHMSSGRRYVFFSYRQTRHGQQSLCISSAASLQLLKIPGIPSESNTNGGIGLRKYWQLR